MKVFSSPEALGTNQSTSNVFLVHYLSIYNRFGRKLLLWATSHSTLNDHTFATVAVFMINPEIGSGN